MRRAEQKDLERLVDLMDQLGYKMSREDLEKNFAYYGSSILVEEREGRVVGCLAYHILPLFHSTEKYMRIVSLVIDQQHRGSGIGKALLQEAEKIAVMEGCTSIELTTGKHRIKTGTHAFYQAHGYASELDSVYFRKKIVL